MDGACLVKVNSIYIYTTFYFCYLILFNETGSSSGSTMLTVRMTAEFGWKPLCCDSSIILAFAWRDSKKNLGSECSGQGSNW